MVSIGPIFQFATEPLSNKNYPMFGQALSFLVVAITCIGCAKKSTDNYEPKTFSEQLVRQAEAGDPVAQLQLGGAYSKGRGVEKNEALAFRWIKTSAIPSRGASIALLKSASPSPAIKFHFCPIASIS